MRVIRAISLIVLVSTPLAAQPGVTADSARPTSLLDVTPGTRVLLIEGRGRKETARAGRIVAMDSATVTLVGARGDTVRVATSAVRKAFRSAGRRPRGQGAAVGMLTGLVLGGALGYSAGSDCGADAFVCFDRSDTLVAGALAGMGVGALIGVAVGGGERWQALGLPSLTSLELRPAGAGFTARVTF